jgi:hypothetical protein
MAVVAVNTGGNFGITFSKGSSMSTNPVLLFLIYSNVGLKLFHVRWVRVTTPTELWDLRLFRSAYIRGLGELWIHGANHVFSQAWIGVASMTVDTGKTH